MGKASSLIKIDRKCIPSKPFLKIAQKKFNFTLALLQISSLFPSAHAVIPKIWQMYQVQTVWPKTPLKLPDCSCFYNHSNEPLGKVISVTKRYAVNVKAPYCSSHVAVIKHGVALIAFCAEM